MVHKTPECDKLHAIKEKSQAVGEFLEWLCQTKGVFLVSFGEDGEKMCYFQYNREQLLAEFFEIDLNKVEEERQAILEELWKQK